MCGWPTRNKRPLLYQVSYLGFRPVGLDYSIAPGQARGLRSSLSDQLSGLVPCQNSHAGSELVFLGSSCSPRVLADQAVEDLPALDLGGHVDHLAGFVQRRSLLPRLMGPMLVVVPRVLA